MNQRKMWQIIINNLMQTPIERSNHRFDTTYDGEILCRTEDDANCVADFLEAFGFGDVHTSENDDEDFRWEVYID